MRPSGLLVGTAMLAVAGPGWAFAQQEVRVGARPYTPPPVVLHAQSNEVALDVVVRRPDGALVGDLERRNFVVLDNGRPRPLDTFSVTRGPARPASEFGAGPAAAAPAPAVAAPAAPHSIALFFDDVNTDKGDLAHARNAALRFVREARGPDDRVALFTASSVQTLDFTRDAGRLAAAIGALRTHPRQGDSQLQCPRITPYTAFLITVEHDPQAFQAALAEAANCPSSAASAVDDFSGRTMTELSTNVGATEPILAQSEATWIQAQGVFSDTLRTERGVVDYVAKQPGARMLLMASGGFLSGSEILQQQQDDIVQDALRGGVVINALDAKGLYAEEAGRPLDIATDSGTLPLATFVYEESAKFSLRQAQDAAMVQLARSTGGLFFHDNNDLTLGFYRLGMIPEATYNLGFSAADVPHDGKYHKLKVELVPKSKDLVQYRPGYFAPAPPGLAASAALPERMDDAVRADVAVTGLAASVRPTATAKGLRVGVHFDQVAFVDQHGRHNQDLRFIATLFTPDGRFVAGEQGTMQLSLRDSTWKKFQSQGFGAGLMLTAGSGTYELRVVVGEASDGRMFSAARPVVIP